MRGGALLVVFALAACSPAATSADTPGAAGDCAAGRDWPAPEPSAARLRDLVNAHRASRGLAPLRPDPRLDAAAEWKARHMARYRYFQHEDQAPPLRRPFTARIAACGFRGLGVAENIAMGHPTPDAVMRTWLNSAGHRANIENAAYAQAGAGAARAANGTIYWVQILGPAAP